MKDTEELASLGDAIVILPDHLHTVWTLPAGDTDYPGRWRAIKSKRSLDEAGVESGIKILATARSWIPLHFIQVYRNWE